VRASYWSLALAQGSGQLSVSRAGSLQFIGAFIELTLDVGNVLRQGGVFS
jgi:hypothetical protein